jgi:hypothetical protein
MKAEGEELEAKRQITEKNVRLLKWGPRFLGDRTAK